MTNKEAIKCLECDFYNMECCTEEECKCDEAITMAIEALEKMDKLNKLMEALAETNFICELHKHSNPWCDWNCEINKQDKIDCIERWLDWSEE